MLALVDRVSETPGRETWHRGVHGGNHRSPGGEDMLQGEGAQSPHDVLGEAGMGWGKGSLANSMEPR